MVPYLFQTVSELYFLAEMCMPVFRCCSDGCKDSSDVNIVVHFSSLGNSLANPSPKGLQRKVLTSPAR